MNTMIWPGAIAMLGAAMFLAAAGFFLLAVQYRRHGRLSWRRTITTTMAAVYGFGLFSYTMLPLPETRDAFCRPGVAETQLHLGHFVIDFAEAYQLGMRSFLTSFTLWQVLLNIILFMPLGVLAVRWLRGNVFTGTLLGLMASLAIELTQYTGLWGLYTCAYRVADVDDLLMNTLGAFLGSILAYLPIFKFLAGPVEPRAVDAPPRPVTRSRRALANLFDAAFLAAGMFLLSVIPTLAEEMGLLTVPETLNDLWIPVVMLILVFFLPALAPGRATLGQRCVWIQMTVDRSDEQRPAKAGALRALLRTVLGFGGVSALSHFSGVLADANSTGALSTFFLIYVVISAICFVVVPRQRGLAGVVTGAGFADRRQV